MHYFRQNFLTIPIDLYQFKKEKNQSQEHYLLIIFFATRSYELPNWRPLCQGCIFWLAYLSKFGQIDRLSKTSTCTGSIHRDLLRLNTQTVITNTNQVSHGFCRAEHTWCLHRAEQGLQRLSRIHVITVLNWSESSWNKATQLWELSSTTGIQTSLGRTLLNSKAKGLTPNQEEEEERRSWKE